MHRIKKLPINLVNQIAAGEVIERPASVVKELTENAIDAGASRVEITISNACRNIRIADNGSGIYPDDIEAAFIKHATSKLSDEKGLFNIQTLGFRGEALASISSIAEVVCITRTKDAEYGTKAQVKESKIKYAKAACAPGTVFEIKELFYNQPARLKFLKSEKTEAAYIQELVQSFALSNPSISFILKNGENTIINTSASSDLLTRISEIYSIGIINEIKEVNKFDKFSGMKITGYISTPDFTRSSKKSIYTFVNSRIVKCPVISKAIDTAYKNMLPFGRWPFAVLNLEIKPEDIDINVHPQKREVRYKNTNQVFSFIQSAVSSTLACSGSAMQNNQYNQNDFSNEKHTGFIEPLRGQETAKVSAAPVFPMILQHSETNYKSDNYEQKKFTIKDTSINAVSDLNLDAGFADTLKQINVIGQFHNTYILVDNGDNLEFIDQHIAQERCIYERLKSEKETVSQLLAVSQVFDAEPSDIQLLERAKPQLEKFGYKIEKVSDTQIIFKKIPQLLSKTRLQDILSGLIENLSGAELNDIDSIEDKILITASCKAAVKAGDKLTLWQMEEIVRNLRNAKNPYTCPHGRPITHKIPQKEIAAFFNRSK